MNVWLGKKTENSFVFMSTLDTSCYCRTACKLRQLKMDWRSAIGDVFKCTNTLICVSLLSGHYYTPDICIHWLRKLVYYTWRRSTASRAAGDCSSWRSSLQATPSGRRQRSTVSRATVSLRHGPAACRIDHPLTALVVTIRRSTLIRNYLIKTAAERRSLSGPTPSWWEGRPTGPDGNQPGVKLSLICYACQFGSTSLISPSLASAITPATNDRLFHSSHLTFLKPSSVSGCPVVRARCCCFAAFVCLFVCWTMSLRRVKLRSLVDALLTRVLQCWLPFHTSPCHLHYRVGLLESSGRAESPRVTALRPQANVTWCGLVQVAYWHSKYLTAVIETVTSLECRSKYDSDVDACIYYLLTGVHILSLL